VPIEPIAFIRAPDGRSRQSVEEFRGYMLFQRLEDLVSRGISNVRVIDDEKIEALRQFV
jgi:hypothetical protein